MYYITHRVHAYGRLSRHIPPSIFSGGSSYVAIAVENLSYAAIGSLVLFLW